MNLKDKAIIVTGSTTGIGEAVARRCVAEGAHVLVHGRDAERGAAVAAELGPNAVFHQDDLSDLDAPERLAEAARSAFGRIDGIVNNAAWVIRSNLDTTDAALFDRAVAVNLRAPLLLIRASIEDLKKSHGCVINVGSVNGYSGESKQLAYSITKGGLQTMTKNLADAYSADHVRFVHLAVGWVLTPNEQELKIAEGRPPDWHENPPPVMVPTGRMTKPEEVAAVTAFWLSDQSRPFSGAVVELEQYPFDGRHPKMVGEDEAPVQFNQ